MNNSKLAVTVNSHMLEKEYILTLTKMTEILSLNKDPVQTRLVQDKDILLLTLYHADKSPCL